MISFDSNSACRSRQAFYSPANFAGSPIIYVSGKAIK